MPRLLLPLPVPPHIHSLRGGEKEPRSLRCQCQTSHGAVSPEC